MNLKKQHYILLSVLLAVLSIYLRYQLIWFSNGDFLMNQDWYRFLQQNGFKGLSNGEFSNYSPPYLYILWLSTLFNRWIPPGIAIKLIPTFFDLISVIAIYKIASIKYPPEKSYLLSALFFTLPTVMYNSTGWGQVDSLYGSFLLVCFYFLLTEQPVPAMIAYGIAFSLKLQTIFLLPFLGILFLRKKILWQHFLIIPPIYLLAMLPAFIAGRSWQSIFQVYTTQASHYDDLARYAPNLYFVIPKEYFHPIFEIGLTIFFISMLAWAWVNWKAAPPITQNQLVLTALASAALVPFLLPKMLDRYFYLADLFSFVTGIFIPELWFFALFFQISSGMVYTIFTLGTPPLLALPAALINTTLVIFIIRHQLKSLRQP